MHDHWSRGPSCNYHIDIRFVEPPVLNMAQVVDDSTCRIPLIFVLSPGVVSREKYPNCVIITIFLQDPTSGLLQLAEQAGMGDRFQALSLGQGQAPIAERMIKNGVKNVNPSIL
jgi:dynein heavy chain